MRKTRQSATLSAPTEGKGFGRRYCNVKDRAQMVSSPPDRENPLNLPPTLLRALESPFVDTLEIVLGYIDGLPPEFKAQWGGHVETIELDCFVRLCCGLQKLRKETMPSEDELDVIAHPGGVFADLAEGFRNAAHSGRISVELETFIEREIVNPLEEASQRFLVGPDRAFIEWWFESRQEDRENPPDVPLTSPEAS